MTKQEIEKFCEKYVCGDCPIPYVLGSCKKNPEAQYTETEQPEENKGFIAKIKHFIDLLVREP